MTIFALATGQLTHAQGNFDIPKVAQQQQAKTSGPAKQEKGSFKTSKKETPTPKPTDMSQWSDYELELKAGNGNARAQYILGRRWILTGDSINVEKGVNWLVAAVKQEYPDAQYALGNLYFKGYGVKRDWRMAKQLMQSAANKGNAKARKFLNDHHL